MRPRHPHIECIVHEEICEAGTDDTALRGAARSRNDLAILLHRRCQPSSDVEQSPLACDVLPDRLQQKIVWKIVEQSFDVEFQNPVILPAPLASHADGI